MLRIYRLFCENTYIEATGAGVGDDEGEDSCEDFSAFLGELFFVFSR